MHFGRSLLASVALLVVGGFSAQATTYSLVNDWSNTSIEQQKPFVFSS